MATTDAITYEEIPRANHPEVGAFDDPKVPILGGSLEDGAVVVDIKPVTLSWFVQSLGRHVDVEHDVVFREHSRLPFIMWAIKLKRPIKDDDSVADQQ